MSEKTANVLIVDDDFLIQEVLGEFLGDAGLIADCASDGEEALAMAVAADYDLILLDYIMPGLNGKEVLMRLRQAVPATPVIMLTGQADDKAVAECLALGAWDHLRKPFDFDLLEAAVNAVLDNRG